MEQKDRLDLDACEARANAATPGPWEPTHEPEMAPEDVRVCYLRDGKHCEWCIALAGNTVDGERWDVETVARWRADAAFIAAARTDVPALVARVRELEARVALPVAPPAEPSAREQAPSADEWRGVAGHARDAAAMLDILADEFAADGYREGSLRREASNMRALADGIQATHPAAPPVPETLREWAQQLTVEYENNDLNSSQVEAIDRALALVGPPPVDASALVELRIASECVELAAEALATWARVSSDATAVSTAARFWERRCDLGHAGHARAEREDEQANAALDAARAEERERCALVCDERERDQKRKSRASCAAEAGTCAARIRALSPSPAEAPTFPEACTVAGPVYTLKRAWANLRHGEAIEESIACAREVIMHLVDQRDAALAGARPSAEWLAALAAEPYSLTDNPLASPSEAPAPSVAGAHEYPPDAVPSWKDRAERAAHEETRREKHEIGDVDAHHIAQLRDAVRQHYARADEVARERDEAQRAANAWEQRETQALVDLGRAEVQRDELRAALTGLREAVENCVRPCKRCSWALPGGVGGKPDGDGRAGLYDALASTPADLAAQVRAEARREVLLKLANRYKYDACARWLRSLAEEKETMDE